MEAVCSEWGIEQVFISPYHPQTNWVRKVNRNLKGMMRSYLTDDHRLWDVHVAEFAFALNSVTHSTTGTAPCTVMLGRQLRGPLHNKWNLDESSENQRNPETVREEVLRNMQKSYQQRKHHYDRRRRHATHQVGDCVMLKTHPQSNAAKHFSAKLAPKWCGPFTILEELTPVNFKLASGTTSTKEVIAHTYQLKPC